MKKSDLVRISSVAHHTNRSFELSEYTPEWTNLFKVKAGIITKVLGDEVLEIEHVGSTSVPGMIAKPQIDILVVVKDLSTIPKYYKQLAKVGFTARGDYTGEGEEYFTQDNKNGKREISVHVLPEGHVWAKDLVNFRDYLLTHPDEAKRYSEVKKRMAKQYPDDYNAYFRGKLKLVKELRFKAADWKLKSMRSK